MTSFFDTSIKNWLLFALIVTGYVLLALYFNEYILTSNIFYNSFAEQLTIERIDKIISMQQRWRWLGYVFVPVMVILRTLAICACVYLRLFFDSKDITFKELMKIVLVAELVFLLESLIRTFYLSFFLELNTLTELQSFSPLALSGLFTQATMPDYMRYPLQTLSIFQVVYIIALAAGVKHFVNTSYVKALLITLGSYGIGLVCWIVFVMFLVLQYGT